MINNNETPDEIPEAPEGSLVMRVKITKIPDEPPADDSKDHPEGKV